MSFIKGAQEEEEEEVVVVVVVVFLCLFIFLEDLFPPALPPSRTRPAWGRREVGDRAQERFGCCAAD